MDMEKKQETNFFDMDKKIIRVVRVTVEVTCQSEQSTGETIKAAQDFVDNLSFAPKEMIDAKVEVSLTPEIIAL